MSYFKGLTSEKDGPRAASRCDLPSQIHGSQYAGGFLSVRKEHPST